LPGLAYVDTLQPIGLNRAPVTLRILKSCLL
jgi:hypothetical protein